MSGTYLSIEYIELPTLPLVRCCGCTAEPFVCCWVPLVRTAKTQPFTGKFYVRKRMCLSMILALLLISKYRRPHGGSSVAKKLSDCLPKSSDRSCQVSLIIARKIPVRHGLSLLRSKHHPLKGANRYKYISERQKSSLSFRSCPSVFFLFSTT